MLGEAESPQLVGDVPGLVLARDVADDAAEVAGVGAVGERAGGLHAGEGGDAGEDVASA